MASLVGAEPANGGSGDAGKHGNLNKQVGSSGSSTKTTIHKQFSSPLGPHLCHWFRTPAALGVCGREIEKKRV